ncbi:hypothetical protein ACUNHR_20685, partial [Serratia sp. IR-2025]
MSGKPIKKKSEQVGQAAPAEVNAPEAPVITPTVTGHYQPVTQSSAPPQPDSAAPELTGSDTIVTLNVSGSQMDTEQVNQDQVTLTDVLAQEYADKPAGVESSAPPQPDSAAPELTGSDTIVTLNVSGSQMD